MSEQKMVVNPAKFLIDSGLLFEINRTILHPFGLAIGVADTETEQDGVFTICDSRDDAEGFLYHESLLPLGKAKLEKFLQEEGALLLERRLHKLGYVVQEGS